MHVEEWKLTWIVCHCETRSVTRSMVSCPLRGNVDCRTCLGCRFLATSSVERATESWCSAWPAPASVERPTPIRVPLPVVAPRPISITPADWPLRLPVVAGPAVRPPEPVPSGHPIGT
jgi:hypothetical protein